MMQAFYKHPNGRAVIAHTTAEAMSYERRGYSICTWEDWYAYYLSTQRQEQPDVLRKDGGSE
jgi:hypothetical protein